MMGRLANRLPQWCWVWLACLIAMAVTRLPLIPPRLYYFDSVNFALALRDFNPALHQPQPPGYPLYVLVCRIIATVVQQPEWVFAVAGVLGGSVAATAAKALGDRMFGRPAGWLAAGLLILNPVFWFGGVTNQVRIYLAAGSTIVALLCWQAWNRCERKWIYLAAASLGLLAGFRPEFALMLAPLFVGAVLRRRRRWSDYPGTLLCLLVCLSLWLIPTALQSGGFSHYLGSVSGYVSDQFRDSSLVFGARPQQARLMFGNALLWNFLGMISWVWCLCFLLDRWFLPFETAAFLSVWFVPPFLFQALIHVADPDQTLSTVPVICLLGAASVQAALRRLGNSAWRTAAVLLVIAAVNVYLFLGKPPKIVRDANYRTVHLVGSRVDSIFTSLERMQEKGPIQIVLMGSMASWRQVGYYFPDVPVVVVEQGEPSSAWRMVGNKRLPPLPRDPEIALDPDRTIVFLPPDGAQWEQRIQQSVSASRVGHLLYVPARHGMHFSIDGLPFGVM